MSKVEWEKVCVESGVSDTCRLRVPSGWLYRLGWHEYGDTAMCFVPDLGALDAVLKLEAAEKERDQARSELSAMKKERDGGTVLFNSLREQLWAAKADHARQKEEIKALKARIVVLETSNE